MSLRFLNKNSLTIQVLNILQFNTNLRLWHDKCEFCKFFHMFYSRNSIEYTEAGSIIP